MSERELYQMISDVYSKVVLTSSIEVSKNIKFEINNRLIRVMGRCKKKPDGFIIELNRGYLQTAEKHDIESTIAHEIMHTASGCFNHGSKWKNGMLQLKRAYNWNPNRTGKNPYVEVVAKFKFECNNCDAKINRQRESKFTQNYQKYTCKCGGRFNRVA